MTSKTILITGASSGFGRLTAELLAREGHTVFASMREIVGKNHGYAEGLRDQQIKVVELDVTDQTSVDRAVESVLDQAGRIDVLVNNAGRCFHRRDRSVHSDISAAMFEHFMSAFRAPDPPNPREVAEAVSRLIAQPKGARPVRTVVGPTFGSDTVNAQTAPVVEALGLGHLAQVA